VIIKVLFAILVLSAAALIGVAVAVFVRVWWHLKSRRAQVRKSAEATQESSQEGLQ
jgi:ABC-type Fe3+ transport system permease subunit